MVIHESGRKAIRLPGDIGSVDYAKTLVATAIKKFGYLDIVIDNAGFQMAHHSIDEIPAEEFKHTFRTNVFGRFFLTQAAPSQVGRKTGSPHQCRGAWSGMDSTHPVHYAFRESEVLWREHFVQAACPTDRIGKVIRVLGLCRRELCPPVRYTAQSVAGHPYRDYP
jgi:NAD(P)-dependent dehydrogenase (short-subunit alcohol dehydrogenase family)